jgi:hypothetical protein
MDHLVTLGKSLYFNCLILWDIKSRFQCKQMIPQRGCVTFSYESSLFWSRYMKRNSWDLISCDLQEHWPLWLKITSNLAIYWCWQVRIWFNQSNISMNGHKVSLWMWWSVEFKHLSRNPREINLRLNQDRSLSS